MHRAYGCGRAAVTGRSTRTSGNAKSLVARCHRAGPKGGLEPP